MIIKRYHVLLWIYFHKLNRRKKKLEEKKTCIASGNLDCKRCNIRDKLICEIDLKKARKFIIGNTVYRLTALTIFVIIGLISNQWWLFYSYGIITALTFIIIEPRLLCSHCPHYARSGKFLKCWALRGIPKLWRYNPKPINKIEKTIMLILGSFIDLFPFVGVIYGFILFFLNPLEQLLFGISLILTTILFTFMVYYFSKKLLGDACKRCPNFSCAMNKVPKDVINKFLDKNPTMRKEWEVI